MEAQISGSSGEHVLDLLSPFVDGETSADETRHIEKHLSECALCTNQLAFLRATARTLRRTADVFPSPALFERIARATYEKPTFAQRVSVLLRPAPVRIGLGSALAAGLVAVALVVPGRVGVAPQSGGSNNVAVTPPKATTPVHSATPLSVAASASFSAQTASLGLAFAQHMGATVKATAEPVSIAPVPSPLLRTPRVMTVGLLPHSLTPRTNSKPASTPDANLAGNKKTGTIIAARLNPVRKPVQLAMNTNATPRLWGGELTSRHLPTPRVPRSDFKIDANVPSATVAVAAPTPVRPDVAVAEPTPKVSSGASETVAAALPHVPAQPDYKFHDSQRRLQNKNSVITVSFDSSASANSLSGSVPIVKAPVN